MSCVVTGKLQAGRLIRIALADVLHRQTHGHVAVVTERFQSPDPVVKTPRGQRDGPEDIYSSLKPRKKKQDIAKELGVSRTTLWRMERMAKEKKDTT